MIPYEMFTLLTLWGLSPCWSFLNTFDFALIYHKKEKVCHTRAWYLFFLVCFPRCRNEVMRPDHAGGIIELRGLTVMQECVINTCNSL